MRVHNQKVTYKFKVVHAYQDYERNKGKFISAIKMVLVNKNYTNSKDKLGHEIWTKIQISCFLL